MDPNGRTEAGSGEPLDHDRVSACPHLIDAGGAWRRGHPTRSHRCAARTPPAPIPALMQKRVCLTDGHLACEFYVAAGAARERALVAEHIRPDQLVASKFHVLTRALPLAVDRATDTSSTTQRRPALIVGGALVAAVVLIGGLVFGNALLPRATPTLIAVGSATPTILPTAVASSGGAATPSGPSVSPATPMPSIAPSATPPEPSPTTEPTPTPTFEPTPGPTPTPEPNVHRYRVRRGDTLQKIANKFDTTVRALVELNDLKNAADIRVGQNLKIP